MNTKNYAGNTWKRIRFAQSAIATVLLRSITRTAEATTLMPKTHGWAVVVLATSAYTSGQHKDTAQSGLEKTDG